jgi:hypothetical protein
MLVHEMHKGASKKCRVAGSENKSRLDEHFGLKVQRHKIQRESLLERMRM